MSGWAADTHELVKRAFVIAGDDAVASTRADTSIGFASTDRAIAFGLAAAIMERAGLMAVELTPPRESTTISELKAEVARLREQIEGPFNDAGPPQFTADEMEAAIDELVADGLVEVVPDDPADDPAVPYEELTPAQKRKRTMAEKEAASASPEP